MSIRLNPYFADGDWPSLRRYLQELTNRSVDSATENYRVLKHRLANTANATSISGTISETNFSVTRTLSRGMYRPGRIFRFDIYGSYTTNTPATSTGYIFRLKFNTSNVVIFSNKVGIVDASTEHWRIQGAIVVRSIGTSGILLPHGTLFFNTAATSDTVETESEGSITVNTTSTTEIVFQCSVQMDDIDGQADLHNFIFEASDF